MKEREEYLKTVSSFYSLFGETTELRHALWPLIVATIGSSYFEDLDVSEKEKVFIAYNELLKFTEAACHLLQEDIMNYRH
ncbi:hypothetical protein GFS24_24645 [Chitinophaga sp. SYP-B3965]|uniref:hypothetical protein n=1 Tax=Chitinophaga sp. SYP-B3965 TaxID=2663120 RepID=UPI001299A770|nr:hypothetical protein [Chitinophaga sp. SYP-B3965]MRG48328.1 hypothetical protein [Chitinophaga sp. SYP-B3965]